MSSKYLPEIPRAEWEKVNATGDQEARFDMLAQPLHEELYRKQDFTFLDELSEGQQLMLSYDYLRQQALQGGFIQLIQNGYIGLLPAMPVQLDMVGDHEMAQIIDDVLKVYVLNRELLDKETSIEEFARLYEELGEFEIIDSRFQTQDATTIAKILDYASTHIEEFATLV